ncbi:MAG: GGDEF domain-containing protein [Eggerthellaceae bacterium]|jgi:diguanylate cyclase (GGDEF)-like protein|nr:GGDEF domain-containing protein [Eggerthellaceae bacterium]MCH4220656.1 GGDEF domain-containing protein [Eggerthellaceae bacterium]
MERSKRIIDVLISILAAILVVFTAIDIPLIVNLQGNAHVMNYAGLIRGGSQRLTLEELEGKPDDKLVAELGGIIDELRTGQGPYDLGRVNDDTCQKDLANLASEWVTLREDVYLARINTESAYSKLYEESGTFYDLSSKTMDDLEAYSLQQESNLQMYGFWTVVIMLALAGLGIPSGAQTLRVMRQNKQLNKIAYVDIGTGLPGKRACEEQLDRSIGKVDEPVCCMMFDLNNLKYVNDAFGHETGDILIADFAALLKQVAPERMFIGRFGGDEFITITTNYTDADAQAFIKNLRIEAHRDKNYEGLDDVQSGDYLSFAYGYAISREEQETSMHRLLSLADSYMYACKARMKATCQRGDRVDYPASSTQDTDTNTDADAHINADKSSHVG